MSPKLFMCESLWWVTFSCIVYTIEKIHKLYSVMCESAWIHLTVSTTTDSRWHIVHARFSMHMIREAIAFFSESTLLGGQRQCWSKKWNRFWISFWRWSAELQQLTAADCWVMNPCSLVGALCLFLARSSLEFWQKALGFGPKFGFPLKWNISERMLSLGGEIFQPSAEFRIISIDFLTMVNTKPAMTFRQEHKFWSCICFHKWKQHSKWRKWKFSNKIQLNYSVHINMAYLVISEQVRISSCCGRVSSSYLGPKVKETKTFSKFWSWDLWTWPRKSCIKKIYFSEWKAFADILTLTFW